ncbi:MAG: maltose alpha-D-glucosyltransferase [Candidatus Bipolaricaulia bacterium]
MNDLNQESVTRRPEWYKDAIIYELHVRAFQDSNGDGIGDFEGLINRLDYLQELGVTALWLLPFYPSPLKDDGYDVSNYRDIHPDYGTLEDFRRFLDEAHQRGLKVITELIVNHTSDQHPWFQRARRAEPGSKERDFYVWSDTPEKYEDARVIFKDFESANWSWDSEAQAYYWHRFYEHQPDLNYDNPAVREAIKGMLDYWLEMGVDGLRLDAVPYLYEREGTNCENLPETHEFLKELRSHIDEKFDHRLLLAEANQWPEDAVEYFGDGDEVQMAYHFPLMPRLFMSLRLEDSFPVIDILDQTPDIPESCQWAIFLRNHDELTLEMVTEEEREYMYQSYAEDPQARINLGIRRRLAPLLQKNRRKIELMKSLLLSLPGTPVIYYGDEIGMGDNIYLGDRNSVRTPMQWSPDRNAGFSDVNSHRLYLPVISDPEYHYQSVNVEAQQQNPSSMLAWTKRLISLRKKFRAFSHGKVKFLHPDNNKILSFLRIDGDQKILVVANLSRFTQAVQLDLEDYSGSVPRELFGRTEFPRIEDEPYFLTLGPHTFYWFSLEQPSKDQGLETESREGSTPTIGVKSSWSEAFTGDTAKTLESSLENYLPRVRWFAGKAKNIQSINIEKSVKICSSPSSWFLPVVVRYVESEPETYSLVLTAKLISEMEKEDKEDSDVIAKLEDSEDNTVGLIDALRDDGFNSALLDGLLSAEELPSRELKVDRTKESYDGVEEELKKVTPEPVTREQSNSAVVYDQGFFLKFFRKLEEGVNPDLEIGKFLTEREFEFSPSVLSSLGYKPNRKSRGSTLAILHEFVPNEGDAWEYFRDHLSRYYERVLAESKKQRDSVTIPDESPLELTGVNPPEAFVEMVGPYLRSAELLGRRTAQLHKALASGSDPDFIPERMKSSDRRSTYQAIRNQTRKTFRFLDKQFANIPAELEPLARDISTSEDAILGRARSIVDKSISATKIRCHGDYHLGQVLFTGNDFMIIDFEGEPERPLSVRRLKRSPLRDVAGMIRSFHYASYSSLFEQESSGLTNHDHLSELEGWAILWYKWISASFLESYLTETEGENFLPDNLDDLKILLDSFILEKSIYEINYELNNRPDWLKIPLSGINQILDRGG